MIETIQTQKGLDTMPFATDGQEKWFAGYTKDTTLGEVRSDYESAFSSQNPDTALRERFEQWLLGEGSPVAVKKYVLAAFQALLLKKTDSNKFKCRIAGTYTTNAQIVNTFLGAQNLNSPNYTTDKFIQDNLFDRCDDTVTLEDLVKTILPAYKQAVANSTFQFTQSAALNSRYSTPYEQLDAMQRIEQLAAFVQGKEYSKNNTMPKGAVKMPANVSGNAAKTTVQSMLENLFSANACKQVILTGAPGTGKTYGARAYAQAQGGEVQFVQFHPAYDYADFVEGLRPITQGGSPTFVRMDGIFKAFCRKIVEENVPSKKYFFLIDEINRADLGRVFGELMFGLEENYRGPENRIHTPYENLPCYDRTGRALANDVFADGFYIPENLYIIGTMNDIDRSVESFDFALRRRFRWLNVRAGAVMEQTLQTMAQADGRMSEYIPELVQRIAALNDYIAAPEGGGKFGLTEDYQIGPAYFKGVYDDRQLDNAFTNRIEPLLREYLRGRRSEDVNAFLEQCSNCLNAMN